tara:strand:+ start:579 stop:710 length:132 start_codon:yes stop_codon:yes gene_type:complete
MSKKGASILRQCFEIQGPRDDFIKAHHATYCVLNGKCVSFTID